MGGLTFCETFVSLSIILSTLVLPTVIGARDYETFCLDFNTQDPLLLPTQVFFNNKDYPTFRRDGPLDDSDCLPFALDVQNLAVYGIKIKSKDVDLKNWIHYELSLPSPLSIGVRDKKILRIEALIIQADSDDSGGIGQFVPILSLGSINTPAPYPTTDDIPLDTQILPCIYRTTAEPSPPTVFVYSRSAEIATPLQFAKPLPPTLHLLWKFIPTMCNKMTTVTFRGVIVYYAKLELTLSNSTALVEHRKAFLIPTITVKFTNNFSDHAPSVFPKNEKLDYKVDLRTLDWVKEVIDDQPNPDPPFPERCNLGPNLFSGCTDTEGLPICHDPPTPINKQVPHNHPLYPEYETYVRRRHIFYCSCPRPDKIASKEPPLISRELKNNTSPLRPLTGKDQKLKRNAKDDKGHRKGEGVEINGFPGLDIWNLRLIHALAHVFSGLFVTPLSIFVTRHYKETFMKSTIIFNKPWFIVHMLSVGINWILHSSGMLAILLARQFLGTTKPMSTKIGNTHLHGSLGWTNLAMFALLVLFGGLRSYNPCMRKICIFMHWLMGVAYYLIALYLIVLSILIPGSPSSWIKFGKEDDLVFFEKYIVGVLVVSWIVVDLSFHIVMDISQCYNDHTLGIARIWWIVPIPALTEVNKTDIPGTKFRKMILLFSFILALGICVTVSSIVVIDPLDKYDTFKTMSCSHDFNNEDHFNIPSIQNCKPHRLFDVAAFLNSSSRSKLDITTWSFLSTIKF